MRDEERTKEELLEELERLRKQRAGLEELEDQRRQADEALLESEKRFRTVAETASDAIVIFDRHENIYFWNQAAKALFGYSAGETHGKLLATIMPKRFCETFQTAVKQVISTGRSDIVGEPVEAIGLRKDGSEVPIEVSCATWRVREEIYFTLIARDITERKRAAEALRLMRLRKALEGIVQAMTVTAEMRDPYTAGHQRRVTKLACAIANEMGLPADQTEGIRMAGLVHDIGKMHVPAEILIKPGRLNGPESGLLQSHPQVGYEILRTVESPWPLAEIILQHHERLDGSGYPSGLRAKEILLEARILAVADVVEALSSHRPYRPAIGVEKALEEICENKGTLYDTRVVDACLRLFRDRDFSLDDDPSRSEASSRLTGEQVDW